MINRVKILLLIFIISSCGKDAVFELVRTEYLGNELKINGYYINTMNDDGVISAYFFYQDGVVLSSGGSPEEMTIEEIENIWLSDEYDDFIKKTKYLWGVFNIADEYIEFETWESGNGSALKTVIRSGDILNDTTFVLTILYNNYNDNTIILNDTFQFKQFSPKPDSTNLFIQ